MKAKLLGTEQSGFKPIKVEITIETEAEYNAIMAAMDDLDANDFNDSFVGDKEDCQFLVTLLEVVGCEARKGYNS